MAPPIRPTADRFWEKVDKSGNCWLWTAHRDKDGYGTFWLDNKNRRATAISYELAGGLVEAGKLICHTCDNPPCVRPSHLFVGTHLDNHKDRNRKHRQAVGEKHGRAKLAEVDVRNILARLERRESVSALAHEFQVSPGSIYFIASGRNWRWIKKSLNGGKL